MLLHNAVTCSYHQYKFIVDGEWRHDETQPFMPDPLGNVNNWLFVRRPEQASQNQGYVLLASHCHVNPILHTALSCAQPMCVKQDLEHQLAAAAVAPAAASAASPAADTGELSAATPLTSTTLPAQPTTCSLTATPAAATSAFPAGRNHQLALQPQ